MSGKKGKGKGASAADDSSEASGGASKGGSGTAVKVNKIRKKRMFYVLKRSFFLILGATYSL